MEGSRMMHHQDRSGEVPTFLCLRLYDSRGNFGELKICLLVFENIRNSSVRLLLADVIISDCISSTFISRSLRSISGDWCSLSVATAVSLSPPVNCARPRRALSNLINSCSWTRTFSEISSTLTSRPGSGRVKFSVLPWAFKTLSSVLKVAISADCSFDLVSKTVT